MSTLWNMLHDVFAWQPPLWLRVVLIAAWVAVACLYVWSWLQGGEDE